MAQQKYKIYLHVEMHVNASGRGFAEDIAFSRIESLKGIKTVQQNFDRYEFENNNPDLFEEELPCICECNCSK